MKSDDLQVLIAREIEMALGGEGSQLSTERAENTRYYLGEKFGNEQEGRSQVVSTDVADTIEWMLPHLIRVFSSGENTVSFEPVGVEDIPVADQATQFVNHIWNHDNEGFINFYTWFKDALIAKMVSSRFGGMTTLHLFVKNMKVSIQTNGYFCLPTLTLRLSLRVSWRSKTSTALKRKSTI